MAKKDQEGQQAPQEGQGQSREGQQGQAPSLSHRDAITADFGNTNNLRARELGYDGYVWQEDKSEYALVEAAHNDQTGPNKTVEDEYDPMEHHFIRADKLDENK
jgi:hypothetical protein